ncbi:MAG: hypothetical protein E6Q93_00965 [Burkholderiaceae bacterium]|nr:MAG: hypothetical protein E6Q93_00965 [Burkholderiaceae bacterium]
MQAQSIANPFALLLDPASVVAQMEGSERLNRLSSRICRPLDKPHPSESQSDNRVDDSDLVIDSDGSADRIA